jgi:glycosyltransferase involved in cell wall biosynthesis
MYRDKAVVSIVIPAYNNPIYTSKTLQSVLSQSYRPIQVVLMDDKSPTPLKDIFEEFKNDSDPGISWVFRRNQMNLGPYWNLEAGLQLATGRYLIIMPHDDWFTDIDFVSSAVLNLSKSSDRYIAIANSKIEHTDQKMMSDLIPSGWHEIDGMDFLVNRLYSDAHPSYSGVVLDRIKLNELGYMKFYLSKAAAEDFNVIPDESFVSIVVLAASGKVILNGEVVSVRGNPETSYSKSLEWAQASGLGVFYPNYLLYKYFKSSGNLIARRKLKRVLIRLYPVARIKIKTVRMFNFEISAISLLAMNRIFFFVSPKLRKLPWVMSIVRKHRL